MSLVLQLSVKQNFYLCLCMLYPHLSPTLIEHIPFVRILQPIRAFSNLTNIYRPNTKY